MTVKPGDWVRFYNGGQLRLAIVQYVGKQTQFPHRDLAFTDLMPVTFDQIMEARSETADDAR